MVGFQELINKGIKNLRIKTKLSQEKFAEMCGLSVNGYRNIEYNRYTPSAETIDKICKTYGLTPIALISYAYDEVNEDKLEFVSNRLKELSEKQLGIINDFISFLNTF